MSVEKVLIVGGGIAGLATAAGLRRVGVACEIVEATKRWAPVGAGIVLGVNAMSVLRRLGLDGEIASRGASLGRASITDEQGRALGESDFSVLHDDFGPTIALERFALHEVLLKAAGDTPISLGTSIEAMTQSASKIDVRLTTGREAQFDLVIGADGLRSRVRSLAFGDVPITYAGYTCWRFVVDAPVGQPELCEMWGRGKRVGMAPVGHGRVYCFAVANEAPGVFDPLEGRLERFRERDSRRSEGKCRCSSRRSRRRTSSCITTSRSCPSSRGSTAGWY